MKTNLLMLLGVIVFFTSCQKEITSADNPNNNGGTTTSGSTNGELLVKGLEITPSTKDTNVITLEWDAAKRLVAYNSVGKVNGLTINTSYSITRETDGKIKTIKSKAQGVFTDSNEYTVHYLPNTSKLSYALGVHPTFIGDINDSLVFAYNGAGQVISKESFSDFLGSWDPQGKEEYTYDANGNITKVVTSAPNGNGGYDVSGTSIDTYDSHKAAAPFGEECFIILGAENVSKNNFTKKVTNAVASGTTYTATVIQQQFNSFDKHFSGTLSVTPKPPGYDVNVLYYYK